jgi:hypothetical protein
VHRARWAGGDGAGGEGGEEVRDSVGGQRVHLLAQLTGIRGQCNVEEKKIILSHFSVKGRCDNCRRGGGGGGETGELNLEGINIK